MVSFRATRGPLFPKPASCLGLFLLFPSLTQNAQSESVRDGENTSFWPKDNYLLKRHGPKHMEKSVAVGMTIFYGSLFLLGVPGNFLTCLIIFMNSYMRAAPNYYLFNLAVADILTLSIGKLYSIFINYLYPFWLWACQSNPKNCFLSAVFVWWCKTNLDTFESYFCILSFSVNSCHFVSRYVNHGPLQWSLRNLTFDTFLFRNDVVCINICG